MFDLIISFLSLIYKRQTYNISNYLIIYILKRIFTLRIETTGIAVQISFGKVYQDSLPFLGFSRQRELSEKPSESYIQRIPLKVEIAQILLCHSSAKIVAVNTGYRVFVKLEIFEI